jgi:hypothetical protein
VASVTTSLGRLMAEAGHPIEVTYRFTVAPDATPFDDDYNVFVHAVDESGENVWGDDHPPSIPTRLWKPGDRVEYTRTMFVSRRAYPGPFSLEIGLYSPRTGRRLPLDATPVGLAAYRAATFEVTPPGPVPVALFVKGWHGAEGGMETGRPGVEWRWSTGEALVWCANPGQDATFFLHLDQPIVADTIVRTVTVRIGGTTLDSFPVEPGAMKVRRMAVPRSLLGSDEIVPITLAVQPTSIPAEVSGSGNPDGRELGVRVFDAVLEAR